MNEDKELEEAVKRLNHVGGISFEVHEAIKTVLQRLKKSKEECRQYREFIFVTGGKDIEDITATQYIKIQQEGYLRGRKEEQEKAKQFIEENLKTKKKIKEILEELKAKKEYKAEPEPIKYTYEILKPGMTPYHVIIPTMTIDEVEEMLQELLELLKED